MAVIGLLMAACSSQLAETRKPESDPAANDQAVVKNIQIHEEEGTVTLRVRTSKKVTYSLYQQEEPLRLVMELPRTTMGEFLQNIPVNSGNVSFVKPGATTRGDSHLEIYLKGQSEYEIHGKGNNVTLLIKPAQEVAGTEMAGAPAAIVEPAPSFSEEPIESRALPTTTALEEVAKAMVEEEAVSDEASGAEEAVEPAEEAVEPAEEDGSGASYVTALEVRKEEGGTLATIRGDGAMQYEYFLVEGKSLVVDIFDAGNKIWPTVRRVDGSYIEQVRIGEHFQPDKKVRVVFDLNQPTEYVVRKGGSQVDIAFGNPSTVSAPALDAGQVVTVANVYFRPLEENSRIEIKADAKPEFNVVDSDDPLRIIVDISSAEIHPEAEKALDLSNLNRSVSKITAFQYKKDESPVVRVVAQLRESVPFRVTAVDETIAIDVSNAPGAGEAAPAAESEPMVAEEAVEEMAVEEEAAPPVSDLDFFLSDEPKEYSGKRLSLDFQEADVNDILRLIADVSGLNFVAGPEVSGNVSIRLSDVPWDQALDIILKTNVPPLTSVPEGENIVRVTTLDKIQQEQEGRRRAAEQRRKNVEAQKKLEPLVTKKFSVSYANINDLRSVVEGFTSERVDQDGLLTIDERTNTIIVRDLQANVTEIERTIQALDSPTPAVVVEARIVEVVSNNVRELGVQWGMGFTADQAHGNALPYEFPNRVSVMGTEGGTAATPFMVNLPAGASNSGIGISFGHIANTLSLDLRLQALEQMGKSKILSTPRVLVVQNETAKINVGKELPIPATDAEGNRTVTWREVGISLEVKPQVTNDRRVFMEIKVAKESEGPPVSTTEGSMFSILSRKAETQVLIADGETAVIGGLSQEASTEGRSNTPGLAKIPVLGWLFKSKSESSNRDELMIFLTPKIVNVM